MIDDDDDDDDELLMRLTSGCCVSLSQWGMVMAADANEEDDDVC